MRARMRFLLTMPILTIVRWGGHAECATRAPVPPAAIAAGTPLTVDSEADPSSLINARVDIGAMHRAGDAIEADLAWTLRLGALRDTAAAYPGITIPEGSLSIDRERIECRRDGMLYYRIEARIVSPAGALLATRRFDAAAERAKAEAWQRQSGVAAGYGPNPRSLVCWAASRKCDGIGFTWPPPPNETPLEHSARATAMRSAYNNEFFPSCILPPAR